VAAIAALTLTAIANIATIPADLDQIDIVQRLKDGRLVPTDEILDNDDTLRLLARVYTVAFAVASVAFLVWIYRARRNLDALGAKGLQYSPGWAVGGFFVPILSLGRPYNVMAEIWRASSAEGGVSWKFSSVHPLLGFWWGLWLIAGWVGGFLLGGVVDKPADFSELEMYAYALLATDLLLVPTAILAAVLVWQFTLKQEVAAQAKAAGSWSGDWATEHPKELQLRLGAAAIAGALVVAFLFAASEIADDASATTSAPTSDSQRLLLGNAARYFDVGGLLPGLARADGASLGLSNAQQGLGPRFSETFVYRSATSGEIVFMLMATSSGSIDVAAARNSLRDEASLEKQFFGGIGASNPSLKVGSVEWSNPSVGDTAKLARLDFSQQGVEVRAEMLVFMQTSGDDAALVFAVLVRPKGVDSRVDMVAVGREISARIKVAR